MMKNKIIILISSIILIILFLLGAIIYIKTNENNDITQDKEEDNLIEESVEGVVKTIDSNSQLLTVKSCIQSFIDQINLNNVIYYTDGNKINESIIAKHTYNLLSKEYINKNSIKEETALNYVNKIEEQLTFVPLKINVLKCSNCTKYSIYGFAYNQKNENKGDMYFILNVDNLKATYSIEPVFNVKNISDIELNSEELTIEKNRYNMYEEKEATEEDICEQYMIMYKELMLSNSNEAYKYLDSEYRNLKYSSIEEFQNFIVDNKVDINNLVMKAYSIDKNKYICEDDKNNIYIFNVNNVLDYTVILDTYTVDLPEFTEKYNKLDDQGKVALNINKIFNAINEKDYSYVYSKLADSFKNNYFNSKNDLKEYLQNNIFNKNEVSYKEFKNQGNNLYTYKLLLTTNESDNGKENLKKISMNIVMQLKEGTDFVMSFSIEE